MLGSVGGAHLSRLALKACGMPPASKFMMDTAKHLASSCGLSNSRSKRGTSTEEGLSGAPGTSLSSCTGVSSQICMQTRLLENAIPCLVLRSTGAHEAPMQFKLRLQLHTIAPEHEHTSCCHADQASTLGTQSLHAIHDRARPA